MENIDCVSFQKGEKSRSSLVRVIVSKGDKSMRMYTLLSGVINEGDDLVVDDENTGEAYHVLVSSIEVGDKRKVNAQAEDIKTLWVRAIDEAVVKIAVSHRETTESIDMKVPGDTEFIVGEKIDVNGRELKIIRIKIRDGGFKSRKGVAIKASDIKRIYANTGRMEPKRFSKGSGGGRIIIKKRESLWSLKRNVNIKKDIELIGQI
jgi:uncharacterized Zn finger protein